MDAGHAGWSEEGECSTSADDGNSASAGRIRKRRFSSARIQPTRIKKVMQSDEDIGRMVASVPVAIGSAMEHFAEKLLEAAAGCVPFSTSRTLSPMHIRYAVMQNPHFAFLESMLKEIPLPKLSTGSDCAITPTQSGQPVFFDYDQLNFPPHQFQSPSTAGQLMDVHFQQANHQQQHYQQPYQPFYPDHMKAFSMGNLSENITLLHQFPLKDDLSLSLMKTEPISSNLESDACAKRKRGRPKKDRKDKYMQDGLNEGPSLEEEKPVALSKNGNSKPSIMQDDRLLMPPPTKLPMRPLVTKASSEDKDTRTSAGPPGSEVDDGPRLNPSDNYAMTSKTPLISPTSQQPTGLLFSGSAGEGDTTTTPHQSQQ